jgi:hypothetical protein
VPRPKVNAHIRGDVPGAKQPELATDAVRLVNDPVLVKAFDAVRNELIRQIEEAPINGDPRATETEREVCRQLRGLRGVRRALIVAAQGQKLREADFRATMPDPKTKEQ